jgi:hypothetical protein
MAGAWELLDKPRFQTEWTKFDLLVQAGGTASLIEFKYYLLRRSYHLDGTPGPRESRAGSKNETEFYACINKLRNSVLDGIGERRLVWFTSAMIRSPAVLLAPCTAATASSRRPPRWRESGRLRMDHSRLGSSMPPLPREKSPARGPTPPKPLPLEPPFGRQYLWPTAHA